MRTPNFDFIGRSRLWVAVSGALVGISLLSIFVGGLDLSIEFVGGSSYRLEGVAPGTESADLREAAEEAGGADVTAQLQTDGDVTVGAIVRMESIEPGSETSLAVRSALQEASGADEVLESFIGPTWGERITRQAVQALLVFLVVVVIYISFRLEFKMAIAAVLALFHDLIITIGIYALVGFPVSPATVIALLTILGYSLYDTVVVFDRVKENAATLGDPGRRHFQEITNGAMNEVVYRSINTSVTSLVPVGALLLLGGQVLGADTLQDLALALFIGMAVGIYSSLFVAGPFFAFLKRQEPEEQKRLAKAGAGSRDARLDGDEISGELEGGAPDEVAPDADEPAPSAARAAPRGSTQRGSTTTPAAGSPEARKPITTEYVRGEGKRKKRRKR
ncbi:MAG: protein translocase subunit SecF [Nitriliruptoraceae bacterium]|nr:protein translocase subunit SecF [Nitriliruptoraceae bacterium]